MSPETAYPHIPEHVINHWRDAWGWSEEQISQTCAVYSRDLARRRGDKLNSKNKRRLINGRKMNQSFEANLKNTLGFISTYIAKNTYAPLIREIAEGVGVSVQTAHNRLDALEMQGCISAERGPGGYRILRKIKVLQ